MRRIRCRGAAADSHVGRERGCVAVAEDEDAAVDGHPGLECDKFAVDRQFAFHVGIEIQIAALHQGKPFALEAQFQLGLPSQVGDALDVQGAIAGPQRETVDVDAVAFEPGLERAVAEGHGARVVADVDVAAFDSATQGGVIQGALARHVEQQFAAEADVAVQVRSPALQRLDVRSCLEGQRGVAGQGPELAAAAELGGELEVELAAVPQRDVGVKRDAVVAGDDVHLATRRPQGQPAWHVDGPHPGLVSHLELTVQPVGCIDLPLPAQQRLAAHRAAQRQAEKRGRQLAETARGAQSGRVERQPVDLDQGLVGTQPGLSQFQAGSAQGQAGRCLQAQNARLLQGELADLAEPREILAQATGECRVEHQILAGDGQLHLVLAALAVDCEESPIDRDGRHAEAGDLGLDRQRGIEGRCDLGGDLRLPHGQIVRALEIGGRHPQRDSGVAQLSDERRRACRQARPALV